MGYSICKNKPPITTELILNLHRRCFGFIFPDWAGTFRKTIVKVSDYTPPLPHTLREHLLNFDKDLARQCEDMFDAETQKKERVVSVAAWMQHRIVWIHPFLDYNGRIARLTTNLLFLEYGLPLVEIPSEKSGSIRNQYVAAMQAADQGDLRPLEKLLWKALQEER